MSNPAVDAPAYFIYNSSMCESWVLNRISTGSDYIKLVAEAYEPTMTQEEHNIIVKTAKENNYLTMTHASTLDAYITSVISNTSIIQHTPANALLADDTIAQIIANRQLVTPTDNIYQQAAAVKTALQLTDEEVANLNQTIYTNVRRMYQAGVPILAGTDGSLNSNGPAGIYFGTSLHEELKILAQIRLSNIDVLKATTSRAAAAYNLSNRGMIKQGLRADLVLIDSNPLEDVRDTRNIKRVWVAGVEYAD